MRENSDFFSEDGWGCWCCKDGHNVRGHPSPSPEFTLLTIWESTLPGCFLGPWRCWMSVDSRLPSWRVTLCRPWASSSRGKAGPRVTLEGLRVWSAGALFSAWVPSSKRSFSVREVSSGLPLPNLPIRVEVKLRRESQEREGQMFCPGSPGRWNLE